MPDDDLLRRLRGAIDDGVPVDAEALVAAAWDDALAEAKHILQAVMTKALLENAVAQLSQAAVQPSSATSPRGGARQPETPAPAAAAARPPSSKEWVWYVYGVTRAGTPLSSATGVGGQEVMQVTAGRLQAIVSRVPVDEFGEAALEERLTDIQWLSREAQAHENVLAAAVSGRAVLPFRFATVYRSQERIADFLNEHGASLLEQLERLAGRHEWSVKVLADGAVIADWARDHDPELASEVAGADEKSAGHTYFARKRHEKAVAAARERLAGEVARTCHEQLAAAAAEATTARPQDPSLSGYEGRMILNGIYLVGDTELGAFRKEFERLEEQHAPRGFSFVMTGPWPPHHFVDMSAISDAAGSEVLS